MKNPSILEFLVDEKSCVDFFSVSYDLVKTSYFRCEKKLNEVARWLQYRKDTILVLLIKFLRSLLMPQWIFCWAWKVFLFNLKFSLKQSKFSSVQKFKTWKFYDKLTFSKFLFQSRLSEVLNQSCSFAKIIQV